MFLLEKNTASNMLRVSKARPGPAQPSKASAARCNCAGPPPFSFQLSETKPERGITRRVLVAWHIRIAHAIVARRPFNAPLSSFLFPLPRLRAAFNKPLSLTYGIPRPQRAECVYRHETSS